MPNAMLLHRAQRQSLFQTMAIRYIRKSPMSKTMVIHHVSRSPKAQTIVMHFVNSTPPCNTAYTCSHFIRTSIQARFWLFWQLGTNNPIHQFRNHFCTKTLIAKLLNILKSLQHCSNVGSWLVLNISCVWGPLAPRKPKRDPQRHMLSAQKGPEGFVHIKLPRRNRRAHSGPQGPRGRKEANIGFSIFVLNPLSLSLSMCMCICNSNCSRQVFI